MEMFENPSTGKFTDTELVLRVLDCCGSLGRGRTIKILVTFFRQITQSLGKYR
jgi:hypothetical protein